MPEISVIIPIFNAASFLQQCIDSILTQTFTNFELICVNDGSIDNSAQILTTLAQKDKRIKIISQKNQGVSVARNVGLKQASAPYICFVDADDAAHPQMLSCLYAALKKYNADIANSLIAKSNNCPPPLKQPIDEAKIKIEIYQDPLGAFMKERKVRTGPYARLYKKEILNGIFFEPNVRYEDIPFTTQVMFRAKSLVMLNEPLYVYVQHSQSFMHQCFTKEKAEDYIKIIRIVHRFALSACPERINEVRRYILNNRIKMAMNQLVRKQKNIMLQKQIFEFLQTAAKCLYQENIISYDGLKLKHKIRLFLLLHCKTSTMCQLWANFI